MTNELETMLIPGLVLMNWRAGRMVSAVECWAPETRPSAMSLVDHHRAVENRIFHDPAGLIGRHAFGFPQFVIGVHIGVEFRRRLGIHRGDGAHVHALLLRDGLDLFPIADQE